MVYAVVFHFLAGAVTGSVFRVHILLAVIAFILAESAVLALAQGSVAGSWTLMSVIAVQAGYLAGIYARGVIEHAGYLQPSARTRRLP